MRTGTNSLTILFFKKNLVNRMFTKVDVLLQAFFCKRFSKKFIFILKLALTNYQPALALSCKRVCKIFNIVLQDFHITPSPPPLTPFLQEIFATCCTFLFFKIIIFFSKKAKAPRSRQACFEGNHDKFYFAFGPRPYFFR